LKGQLSIEYLVSFGIFVSTAIYVYLLYTSNIPGFLEEIKKENIRAEAYRLSELLVNDVGDPSNWNTRPYSEIKRIGLTDQNINQTNFISKLKIQGFEQKCQSSFSDIQKWVGLDKPFSVLIFDINQITGERTLLSDCRPSLIAKSELNATVKRITAYSDGANKKLAEIIIQT
jgi:hypothetical protein